MQPCKSRSSTRNYSWDLLVLILLQDEKATARMWAKLVYVQRRREADDEIASKPRQIDYISEPNSPASVQEFAADK